MHFSMSVATAIAAIYIGMSSRPVQAQETRTFVYGNFLCTDGTPLPTVTRTPDRYFHEVIQNGKIRHQVCANVSKFSVLSQLPVERRVAAPVRRECETFELVKNTIRCKGGDVSTARFFMAADSDHRLQDSRGPFKISGNTLFAPLYGSYWRAPDAYVPLPEGYGFLTNIDGAWRQLNLPWTALAAGTAFTAVINVPAPPVPLWLVLFSQSWPWPQIVLAMPLVFFAVLAFTGLRTSEKPAGSTVRLLIVCAIALYAVFSLRLPPEVLDGTPAHANSENLKSEIETVRFLPGSNMAEPFSEAQLKHTQSLLVGRDRSQEKPWLFGAAMLFPSLIFVLVYGASAARGWHYLFVAHPASPIVGPPLRSGALFPKQRLASALSPNPADLFEPPPAYQSHNMQRKSEALKDKIAADANIAEAAMRRDRARAEQMKADADLRALRKSLTWWQRWFG